MKGEGEYDVDVIYIYGTSYIIVYNFSTLYVCNAVIILCVYNYSDILCLYCLYYYRTIKGFPFIWGFPGMESLSIVENYQLWSN